MSGPVIALFRLDLRLDDNPALSAAVVTGQPVICLYVLDDRNSRALGGASSWWLHHSLADLDRSLRACGGQLILRRGKPADIVVDIARTTGATAVYLARRHEPWAANQENDLHRNRDLA